MLQKIENRKHSDQKTKVELKERLNRIYLSLVDMYLRLDDGSESAQQLVVQLEKRLEQDMEENFTSEIMSELGNTLRKHN